MEILSLPQIIWQALNFLLLYFVIAKFVVPPTRKFLEKREQEIAQGLENAQVAKKQLEDAEKMKDEVLAGARNDAAKVLEEVRGRAEQMASRIEEEAKVTAQQEAERIREQGKADMEGYKKQLEAEAVRLAELISKKALGGKLDVNMQHELLEKQLNDLKKDADNTRMSG
jgi:F-type H+-transporting ATPase subunit b